MGIIRFGIFGKHLLGGYNYITAFLQERKLSLKELQHPSKIHTVSESSTMYTWNNHENLFCDLSIFSYST